MRPCTVTGGCCSSPHDLSAGSRCVSSGRQDECKGLESMEEIQRDALLCAASELRLCVQKLILESGQADALDLSRAASRSQQQRSNLSASR
eukprot:762714-Hanusia_phi.AAC.7